MFTRPKDQGDSCITRLAMFSALLSAVREAKLKISSRYCALLAFPQSSHQDDAVRRNRSDWSCLEDLERWLVDIFTAVPSISMYPVGVAMIYRLPSGQLWVLMPSGNWVCAGEEDGETRTILDTLKTDAIAGRYEIPEGP